MTDFEGRLLKEVTTGQLKLSLFLFFFHSVSLSLSLCHTYHSSPSTVYFYFKIFSPYHISTPDTLYILFITVIEISPQLIGSLPQPEWNFLSMRDLPALFVDVAPSLRTCLAHSTLYC